MRQVVVYVFYLWLALSFLYVVVQVVRKMTGPKAAPAARKVEPAASAKADPTADPKTGAVATLLAEEAAAEEPLMPPKNTLTAPKEPDTVPVEPLRLEPTEAAEPVGLNALPPPAVVLGEPAPDSPTPMAAPADASLATPVDAPLDAPVPERASLASLLAGIRLPHDLLPVVPQGLEIDEHHVSLLTSTAPAEVVGPAVADELERLGYRLEPRTESELTARRDGNELVLGIVTSPALTLKGGEQRYPTATDGDVLITIDVA